MQKEEKKTTYKVKVSIAIDFEVLEKLRKIAEKEQRSLSNVINMALSKV